MGSIRHLLKTGLVCVTLVVLGLYVPAQGVEFAGGTGEPDDPYQIATASQLLSLGSDPNLRSRHFILVADIDMEPRRSLSPSVWAPLSETCPWKERLPMRVADYLVSGC